MHVRSRLKNILTFFRNIQTFLKKIVKFLDSRSFAYGLDTGFSILDA